MKTSTLEKELLRHLEKNGGWVKKVDMFIVADNEGYSPETAGRLLRTLAEEGKIFVEYYKGKRNQKLAKYSFKQSEKKVPHYQIVNGVVHLYE